VEITTGHNCWEASDQRRDTKRHSKKWRFVLLGSDGIRNSGFKALRSYCGGSHRDYLRTFRGACTIKLAYQAADANHPGTGSEGSPLTRDIFGTQRRPIRPSSRGFYRTGITQGNAGENRTERSRERAESGFVWVDSLIVSFWMFGPEAASD